jgi:hypothetical protein
MQYHDDLLLASSEDPCIILITSYAATRMDILLIGSAVSQPIPGYSQNEQGVLVLGCIQKHYAPQTMSPHRLGIFKMFAVEFTWR